MADQTSTFQKLAELLDAPGSSQLITILKATVTPQEADLMLAVWNPVTCEDLAKKLAADESPLRTKLDVMVKKGVITLGKNGYQTHQRLTPLCHATVNMTAYTDKLWTDFFFGEWRPILVRQRAARRATGQWSVHRILPALQALAISPHIRPEQILWYENLDALLQQGKSITFAPCTCRRQYQMCHNKEELCMHVIVEGDPNPPTGGRWTKLKQYTYKEALAELYASEDAGMCHLCQNHPHLRETCNCCGDCCRVINPMVNAGGDYDANDPTKSRFQASINQELCNGCQTCVERCMFNAIEMRKTEGSKKMKAYLTAKLCMGCGLCVYTCPQKAIRFDLVRPPNHIPNITQPQAMSWAQATPEEIRKAFSP